MDIEKLIKDLHGLLKQYGEKIPYSELVGAPWPYSRTGDLVWQDPEPYLIEQAVNAITDLLARAEAAEARCKTLEKMVKEYQDIIVPGYRERTEKAERERDEAVRICAKLIALCSPPKEWVPKLFRRHINRPGDYMGCGYTFLDGFNQIIENFVETADDQLYTAIRNATEKEIIERK